MSRPEDAAIFVPWRLLENLEKRVHRDDRGSSGAPKGATSAEPPPRVMKLRMAAVFIADISGFSRLENVFEGATNLGVDTFSALLNSVLGGLETVVGPWADALFTSRARSSASSPATATTVTTRTTRCTPWSCRGGCPASRTFESVFKKMGSRLGIHVSWGSLDVIRLARSRGVGRRCNDTDPGTSTRM